MTQQKMAFLNAIFYFYVPRTGLEPASLAALPPQGSEFTNFSTWALICRIVFIAKDYFYLLSLS